MKKELKIKGAPSWEELINSPAFPGEKDRHRGPIAIIECIEEIPCNPCEASCPAHAIKIGSPITNLPRLDIAKCVGCGKCISACPGLCIMVKDWTYSETECTVSFPFEYYPLPEKGQQVDMVDRYGEVKCKGTVLRIVDSKANDHTVVITASYPKEFFDDVVNIKKL